MHGTEGQPSPAAGFAMALPKCPVSPNNNTTTTASTTTTSTPTTAASQPIIPADRHTDAVTGGIGDLASKTGSTVSTTVATLPLVATTVQQQQQQQQCRDPPDGKASGKGKKGQRTKYAASVQKQQQQQQQSAAALDLANGNTLSSTEQNAMVNETRIPAAEKKFHLIKIYTFRLPPRTWATVTLFKRLLCVCVC